MIPKGNLLSSLARGHQGYFSALHGHQHSPVKVLLHGFVHLVIYAAMTGTDLGNVQFSELSGNVFGIFQISKLQSRTTGIVKDRLPEYFRRLFCDSGNTGV